VSCYGADDATIDEDGGGGDGRNVRHKKDMME
jgi:hypothetical protein